MPTSEFKVIGKEVVLTPKSEHYFSNILLPLDMLHTITTRLLPHWWCNSVLASSVVDHGFKPHLGQRLKKIGICCFSAPNTDRLQQVQR
jgi:hypothetical protein